MSTAFVITDGYTIKNAKDKVLNALKKIKKTKNDVKIFLNDSFLNELEFDKLIEIMFDGKKTTLFNIGFVLGRINEYLNENELENEKNKNAVFLLLFEDECAKIKEFLDICPLNIPVKFEEIKVESKQLSFLEGKDEDKNKEKKNNKNEDIVSSELSTNGINKPVKNILNQEKIEKKEITEDIVEGNENIVENKDLDSNLNNVNSKENVIDRVEFEYPKTIEGLKDLIQEEKEKGNMNARFNDKVKIALFNLVFNYNFDIKDIAVILEKTEASIYSYINRYNKGEFDNLKEKVEELKKNELVEDLPLNDKNKEKNKDKLEKIKKESNEEKLKEIKKEIAKDLKKNEEKIKVRKKDIVPVPSEKEFVNYVNSIVKEGEDLETIKESEYNNKLNDTYSNIMLKALDYDVNSYGISKLSVNGMPLTGNIVEDCKLVLNKEFNQNDLNTLVTAFMCLKSYEEDFLNTLVKNKFTYIDEVEKLKEVCDNYLRIRKSKALGKEV